MDVNLIGKDKYLLLLNDLTTTVPKPPVFNVHCNDHCTVSQRPLCSTATIISCPVFLLPRPLPCVVHFTAYSFLRFSVVSPFSLLFLLLVIQSGTWDLRQMAYYTLLQQRMGSKRFDQRDFISRCMLQAHH